jgi:hypothetical protein
MVELQSGRRLLAVLAVMLVLGLVIGLLNISRSAALVIFAVALLAAFSVVFRRS